jgi:tetrahydromethanopterin S-methyltransferase subunit F
MIYLQFTAQVSHVTAAVNDRSNSSEPATRLFGLRTGPRSTRAALAIECGDVLAFVLPQNVAHVTALLGVAG